ncbi:MAG: Hsp20/alpha crystallin family protein [Isosphaeraceae bacterium]|nr:Hsp20/alpha crystallin family protein [Isosphaeraceae bacterium]
MNNHPYEIRVVIGPTRWAEAVASAHTSAPSAPEGAPVVRTPPIDIHEGPDGLVLEADLPGATNQNLSIRLEDNVLTLHARIEPAIPEGARPIPEQQEFRAGEFLRSFILSDEIDRDGITAELKNGVLRLCLPRAERAKTRRIEIKAS